VKTVLEALGRCVRDLRRGQGWTLRQLALRARLSPRFLAQVESGQGNISVRNLARLARALGTTPAGLLSDGEDESETDAPVIALVGLRGAGKTTIGRRLARHLRVSFVELDRRIEQAAELSLAEIFVLHGETYYRRLERDTLERVLSASAGRPFVLAVGGGLPTSPETYALLRSRALTIWLKAAPEDHWNRVVQQGDRRPMADHPHAMAELRRLLSAREPLYAQARHTVDTSRLSVEGVIRAIRRLLPSPQRVGQERARRRAPGTARARSEEPHGLALDGEGVRPPGPTRRSRKA
jgi:XRE family aerobic/anaerobic benzoate catabolism transcriptional regulator